MLLFAAAVAVVGIASFDRLRIDAVPDITNIQVQINTVTEGLTPQEVEQQVTFPVETAMGGIPGVTQTRSFSRYGLSQVSVIFRDGTDLYFARQRVNERLDEARANLPPDTHPEMGPIATAPGETFRRTGEAKPGAPKPDGTTSTATHLRQTQARASRPQLRAS